MPSSTFATVSHASTARLERVEDVLPADHDHRVDAGDEEVGDRGALDPVALVLEPVDLDELRRRRRARCAGRAALAATCSAAATSTAASSCGLLHRRLDAVERELVGGLLGEVDDVVERAGERVHVGGVQVRAARLPRSASRWMDVVDDPVALLLAQQDVARERRPARGSPRAGRAAAAPTRCTLRPDSSNRLEQLGVGAGDGTAHRQTVAARSTAATAAFTGCSRAVHGQVTGMPRGRVQGCARDAATTRARGGSDGGGAGDPALRASGSRRAAAR